MGSLCVQGKAVTGVHRKQKDEEDEVTVIPINYAGMKVRELDEDSFPIIVIHDRKSQTCFVHLVPRKGFNEYAVECVTQDLQKILGYTKFVLKSDQEAALTQRKEADARQCMHGDTKITQIIAEESPVGESQSNGEIENDIKQIEA